MVLDQKLKFRSKTSLVHLRSNVCPSHPEIRKMHRNCDGFRMYNQTIWEKMSYKAS